MTDLNKSYTLLVVDRSGSMLGIREDTEGGLASYLEEQKKVKGEHNVTLVQFDTEYNVVYDDVSIDEVPKYKLIPRDMTALYDAVGRSVTDLGIKLERLPESQRPASVNVVILTDGLENASREWTGSRLKELIKRQQDVYSWNFTFMGSNQDAVLTGKDLGFDPNKSLTYTGQNVAYAFRAASSANNMYRSTTASGANYGDSIASSYFTEDDRAKAVSSK